VADVNARAWRPEAGPPILAEAAEPMARQAASFLAASVAGEIDGARVGVTHVLATPDAGRVYACAVVAGPVRAYLATASGPAGHATRKYIVSYPDAAGAGAALDALLTKQKGEGYAPIGTIDGDA